jgi:hypothetical protein
MHIPHFARRAAASAVGTAAILTLALTATANPAAAAATPAPSASTAPTTASTSTAASIPAISAQPTVLTDSRSPIELCAADAYLAGFSYTAKVDTVKGALPRVVVAVAVAMAESSCNPKAEYTNPGGCQDRGLWQVDSCAHPNVSEACAYDGQCNADAAWTISDQGSDWTPWTMYRNGTWKNFLADARKAVTGFKLVLRNQKDGTCLDAGKTDKSGGGPVEQWKCAGTSPRQQWTIETDAHGAPTLRNVATRSCLEASRAHKGNGGVIQQSACAGTDAYQRWQVVGSGDLNADGRADAGLRNAGAATCLRASKASTGNGGLIQQWACAARTPTQEWS